MYTDAHDPSRWWVLPPNVSFNDDHWSNRRTPNHSPITDGDHAYQLVLCDRQYKNAPVIPDQSSGRIPPMEDPNYVDSAHRPTSSLEHWPINDIEE